MTNVKFVYNFLFEDKRLLSHVVELDGKTGWLIPEKDNNPPEPWTALEYHKCEHCPLKSSENPQCPVAKNLASVANKFKDERSFAKVTVEVDSEERTYRKSLPLQEGLFGLFGLIMATSSCPYFSFLRPMARFHLPFSTLDETMVRSAGFYLFKQYFVAGKGGKADFELKEVGQLYDKLNFVNQGLVKRIRAVAKADAEANSIINLDGFAMLLSQQATQKFSDLERLFF